MESYSSKLKSAIQSSTLDAKLFINYESLRELLKPNQYSSSGEGIYAFSSSFNIECKKFISDSEIFSHELRELFQFNQRICR